MASEVEIDEGNDTKGSMWVLEQKLDQPMDEEAGRLNNMYREKVDVQLRNEDLKIHTYRSGGSGGQHANTTNSAVMITHLPSGLTVVIHDVRSQHQGRWDVERDGDDSQPGCILRIYINVSFSKKNMWRGWSRHRQESFELPIEVDSEECYC